MGNAIGPPIVPEIIKNWEPRVVHVEGAKLAGSGVLISKQSILTAAHLSFKLEGFYPIKGSNNQVIQAKCVFICTQRDFAILQSEKLPNHELSTNDLNRGDLYFMMGYPNGADSSKPTFTVGIIEGSMKDLIHLIGTPALTQDYSGAPVFCYSGKLAGILLGGTSGLDVNSSLKEALESAAEQKYTRILPISVIIDRYRLGKSNSEL